TTAGISRAYPIPATIKSTSWLLKLMIPISLAVTLLQHYGVLALIATYLHPVFVHLGLPGASAVAFVSGASAGTYAGIAAMMSMPLTMRQATILSLMLALCHALPMECAVNRNTGSSFWLMAVLRIAMAFVCAALLNMLLPETTASYIYLGSAPDSTIVQVMATWMLSQIKMALMVFAIIYALMVVQQLIEAYSLLVPLSVFFAPMMHLFGLPRRSAYMWLVGNILGISYGSAVMVELEQRKIVSREDANDVNYHLIMNHSLIEDTIVFAATGVSALLLVSVRLVFALVLVWTRRAIMAITQVD
ncbi:MAG: nucleoside recognition domain-containing protein, partial [Muribaculaceae bacterium]